GVLTVRVHEDPVAEGSGLADTLAMGDGDGFAMPPPPQPASTLASSVVESRGLAHAGGMSPDYQPTVLSRGSTPPATTAQRASGPWRGTPLYWPQWPGTARTRRPSPPPGAASPPRRVGRTCASTFAIRSATR